MNLNTPTYMIRAHIFIGWTRQSTTNMTDIPVVTDAPRLGPQKHERLMDVTYTHSNTVIQWSRANTSFYPK